ncbi:MAG TPA: hypothetical protein VFO69_03415 [Allosphingosinicella sp.]|nr:hypothetical protein [Allosphingosinicella sp.]
MARPAGKSSGKYVIKGTRGDDIIDGRTYDLALQERGLSIDGSAGNDILRGGSGQDYLNGNHGNDTLIADESDLSGVASGTLIYQGGSGVDTLDLSAIPFAEGTGLWIRSGGGTTWIATDFDTAGGITDLNWSWGERWIDSFAGIENFRLGDGDDNVQLITGAGSNTVWAGAGDDFVEAGDGNDVLFGEDGNDVLSHGWGDDVMTGGLGNDAFLLAGRVVGQYTFDRITDFDTKSGEADTQYDAIWLYNGWTLTWDASSTDVLRGHFYDPAYGEVFGEIILEGLTYADSALVPILSYDPMTGIAT